MMSTVWSASKQVPYSCIKMPLDIFSYPPLSTFTPDPKVYPTYVTYVFCNDYCPCNFLPITSDTVVNTFAHILLLSIRM